MEAWREVFGDRTKEDTRKVIEREEREIDTMIKRHRESLTPPAREDKRKKQGGEMETKEKPSLPRRQPVVKPETGAVSKTKEVARERAREREEETTKPRSRTSSTSSQQSQPDTILTEQIGIVVYVRKSSHLDITSRDSTKRGEIRRAILKGEIKFTWKNPKVERQNLMNAFARGRVDMDEIEYKRVDNAAFGKIYSVCTGIYGSQE